MNLFNCCLRNATDSADYEQRSDIVVFDVGVAELVVNITILDNSLSEEDRFLFMNLKVQFI